MGDGRGQFDCLLCSAGCEVHAKHGDSCFGRVHLSQAVGVEVTIGVLAGKRLAFIQHPVGLASGLYRHGRPGRKTRNDPEHSAEVPTLGIDHRSWPVEETHVGIADVGAE